MLLEYCRSGRAAAGLVAIVTVCAASTTAADEGSNLHSLRARPNRAAGYVTTSPAGVIGQGG